MKNEQTGFESRRAPLSVSEDYSNIERVALFSTLWGACSVMVSTLKRKKRVLLIF